MPGAPVMSRSFKENCADSDVMEDSTVTRQESNAKPLENSEEISRREDRNEETLSGSLFGSPKKIDSLFDRLEHEPLGEACYIQQYALHHNLSLEEAGRKVEENGIIGKRGELKSSLVSSYENASKNYGTFSCLRDTGKHYSCLTIFFDLDYVIILIRRDFNLFLIGNLQRIMKAQKKTSVNWTVMGQTSDPKVFLSIERKERWLKYMKQALMAGLIRRQIIM
uniref:Cation_ATPase_N domain-containing protein n=1 Tax=Angiostrongylus cantonensis TaxID=6313 RepID=A0A0K0DC75_ANGCA